MRCGVKLAGVLVVAFAAATVWAQVDMGTDAQRADGKKNYDKFCAQCHGLAGDGQGYATNRVKPLPRDFTRGKYKFRTTSSGRLPTDADIARIIRLGAPYTSMPGWPQFTDQEVQNLVYYLKTFAPDFQNADLYDDPIEIPKAPASSEESVARGREVYESQGCAACHGNLARGDGPSAPTMVDDWGDHLRPADMTKPWTFRGGPTKQDMFRTFTTGLNGTPMPAYEDVLDVEDRWHLVNYMASLSDSETPDYAELLLAEPTTDEIDLADTEELFAKAPVARFPIVGQIIDPGRNFYPGIPDVEVQAVYNRQDIAIRVRWNDMRAETAGHNSPTLQAALWDEEQTPDAGGGDEDEGGFWGAEEVEEDAGSIWGDDEIADDEDDFWGEGDDDVAASGDQEFSDAVAIQFPRTLPTGIRKPYFLFGDSQSPVDLWFVDLAEERVRSFTGRGRDSIEPFEGDDIETHVSFDEGRWTVIFKRARKSRSAISFDENQFTPISFSVWDGFNRERGNKRGLSPWFYIYTKPMEVVSPVGPMLRAGLIALVLELLALFYLRKRYANGVAAQDETPKATPVPQRG